MIRRTLAVLLATTLLSASHARGEEPRFGMNRVNLAWEAAPTRQQIIEDMARHGVDLVRLSLTPPFEASIDALRIAHQHRMRILLEIPLSNERFYPPATLKRSGHGRIWDIHRLSDIDPAAFRDAFRHALKRIDAFGITLIAVQPGNELNLGGYNGDLHVYAVEERRTTVSRGKPASRAAFRRGMGKYREILQIVRAELDSSPVNRQAKIVSAGVSDIGFDDAHSRGMEHIPVSEFIGILQTAGIADHIDAFGVHVYSSHTSSKATRQSHVRSVLSFCQTSPKGKPCWITEWGVANTSDRCPLHDGPRETVIQEVRELLDPLMREKRLAKAFYFDWDSNTPYSVWRCGTLSPAGIAAVAPDPQSAKSTPH